VQVSRRDIHAMSNPVLRSKNKAAAKRIQKIVDAAEVLEGMDKAAGTNQYAKDVERLTEIWQKLQLDLSRGPCLGVNDKGEPIYEK
jgi:hypothetical protein